jgi:acyl carrier protein
MTSDTFDIVADTIAAECAVPREKITPDSHVVEDLGLDSLAFLDLCYALDMKLKIKIPYEQWVNDINSGKLDVKQVMLMRNIVSEVDKIRATAS